MNALITLNTMDEFFSALIEKYGFSLIEKNGRSHFIPHEEIGTGSISFFSPAKEVLVSITNMRLNNPIAVHSENYDSEFEVSFCFSGYVSYSESGMNSTRLRKGELGIYLKNDTRGTMLFPANENIKIASIVAVGELKDSFPRLNCLANCEHISDLAFANKLANPSKVGIRIHNLFSEIVEDDINYSLSDMYCEGLSKTILTSLWHNKVLKEYGEVVQWKCTKYEKEALLRIRYILDKHYANPPYMTDLCKEAGLNEYRLRSCFKNQYGKTIYEYVKTMQMENARKLMENEDLSISEIAYEVGYINTSHFARAFRKRYGMNPRDFRIGV